MSFHLLRLSEVGEMDYTSIVTCARYYNAVPKERKDRGFDLLFPLITPQSFEQYIEDTHQIDSFAEEEKSRYKKFLSDYKEYCRIKLLAMPHAKKVEHDEAVATERPQLNFPEIEMMNTLKASRTQAQMAPQAAPGKPAPAAQAPAAPQPPQ